MTKQCKSCGQHKSLEDFSAAPANVDGRVSACKPCVVIRNRDYWRTMQGRVSYIYSTQCANSKARGHAPPTYTRDELFSWAQQNNLAKFMDVWEASGYSKEFAPSVDRINDVEGYSFSNVQLVCWKDNNERAYAMRKSGQRITRQNKQVNQFTLSGQLVNTFPSIALAARATGAIRTNINAMCAGKPHIKSVGGYLWQYA